MRGKGLWVAGLALLLGGWISTAAAFPVLAPFEINDFNFHDFEQVTGWGTFTVTVTVGNESYTYTYNYPSVFQGVFDLEDIPGTIHNQAEELRAAVKHQDGRGGVVSIPVGKTTLNLWSSTVLSTVVLNSTLLTPR